jgi:hypothetical protein
MPIAFKVSDLNCFCSLYSKSNVIFSVCSSKVQSHRDKLMQCEFWIKGYRRELKVSFLIMRVEILTVVRLLQLENTDVINGAGIG